jgi:hypothetical protein
MITLIKMSGRHFDELSITVPKPWIIVFQTIISTILRSSLSIEDVEEINRIVAGGLTQGKMGQSPRCHTEMTGFDETPTFVVFDNDFNCRVTKATLMFKGIKIIYLIPKNEIRLFDPCFSVDDKFYTGRKLLDKIRETFAQSALRKLSDYAPNMVKFFGQGSLLVLLSFQKDELKAIASVFGQMISHDFSESSMIKDFWFLIMKWLVFSRFVELFVALVTNMIQIPGNGDLTISDTGLQALKTLLQPITPIPYRESCEIQISHDSENRIFTENMYTYLKDLRMFASAFSQHVLSTTKFDGHITAIERSLSAIETRMSPTRFSKNMKLFSQESTSRLSSSESKGDITTIVLDMLKGSKYSKVNQFFQTGPGTHFVDLILEARTRELEKAKKMVDAQNDLTKAQIKSQKLQQKLLVQTAKTNKLARHSEGNIGFDLRDSLDSERSSKRPRPEQSSEAKHTKKPAFDLRDGL